MNIATLKKAIAALEKGMAGAFLQTTPADVVRQYAMEKADLPDATGGSPRATLSRAARSPAS
eukprot:15851715-Heterocapsa_arctica.AAC.1